MSFFSSSFPGVLTVIWNYKLDFYILISYLHTGRYFISVFDYTDNHIGLGLTVMVNTNTVTGKRHNLIHPKPIKMETGVLVWLIVTCVFHNSVTPYSEAAVGITNNITTVPTNIKQFGAKITDTSDTEDYPSDGVEKCHRLCSCSKNWIGLNVKCTGEDIKSLEELNLPSRTTGL